MSAARHTAGYPLDQLLEGIGTVPSGVLVTGLAVDSRRVSPGDLFLAVPGSRAHGTDFVAEAIARGASAVAYEGGISPAVVGVPAIHVSELRRHIGEIAARFHGYPGQRMRVAAITGTNGKTSTCHYLAQMADGPCGIVGTLGAGWAGQPDAYTPLGHTTPDPLALQAQLASFLANGARRVVLEASSHGLAQHRLNGTPVSLAVFTNLSRDHLDYHADESAYAEAKERLFHTDGLEAAVLNADDPMSWRWQRNLAGNVRVMSYGQGPALPGAEMHLLLERIHPHAQGLTLTVAAEGERHDVTLPLLGRFNAYNLLAALAALIADGVELGEAVERSARVRPVPGRMERFGGAGQPQVVVDYAHTPDALAQALAALAEHRPGGGRTLCVFGCGGDRDPGKRPLMGRVAERAAGTLVITSDNPRTEPPERIIEDILKGCEHPERAVVIPDRTEAIRWALTVARPEDQVLVAGKGHEDYQEVDGERRPFSDRAQVANGLREWLG